MNYERAMARLRAAHAQDGIRVLEKIGPPPYKRPEDILTERDRSSRYDIPSERDLYTNMASTVFFAPGWSLWEIYEFLRAGKVAVAATFDANSSYDARTLGPKFDVPFFIFNGELDSITPTDLARQYFDHVEAPRKTFVALKGVGHSAVLTEPDVFLHELVTRVRPIAAVDSR